MNRCYLRFGWIAFFLVAYTASAQKIMLKADALTTGASTVRGYTNYSEITSVQFGVDAETSYLKGTGPAVGKPTVREVTITKYVDVSSNKLWSKITAGIHTSLVEIVSLSDPDLELMHKIELKDAFVTSISASNVTGCTQGCPSIAESYKFVFKAIRITTYSRNGQGTLVPSVFVYNVAKNNDSWD